MRLLYNDLFPAMWFSWAAYWWILSHHVKSTARREPWVSRLLHIGPLVLAFFLLWTAHFPIEVLRERFLPQAAWPFWVGASVTATGLLFAVWARRHIGKNWSATVTIKQGHELVTTGPYALVRHPIYTGLLLAFAGSAMARGEWRGILAFVIALAALWRKLRFEERWMREQFGAAYQSYSQRVKALLPFVL